MPILKTRHAHPAPFPQDQPANHGAQHTPWHPHRIVDSAMSSTSLLGLVLFSAAVVLFLCRRRMRNSISRIVSQAIEVASAPSLHIHIHGHGQSSSNDYTAVPDSPMSPMSAPFSPSPQYPPTPNIADTPAMARSLHIDMAPSRPSTVQITHMPAPSKVTDARTTSRGSLTSITFYPDSPTSSSAPSTPALSECDAQSPRSETMPLTPRMSFEEDVKVVPSSPSPSCSAFSSSSSLDSFRIQTSPLSVQAQVSKPAPNSLPAVPTIIEPVARPPSPTMTISIHTTLPSQTIARARSGSTAPVPPNIVLTSVPRRPAQPETPLSPPHTLAVPSTRPARRQPPPRPVVPPPAYEAPKNTVDIWTQPTAATAPNPPRARRHTRQHTLKRPPPPPPKPIIPLDLEAIYPSEDTEAEVTPAAIPSPVITLRRPPPPPAKPIMPFELEPVYPEEKSEKVQIRYSQYDECEDEEVETPTSATMFFKALVEKGKREVQVRRENLRRRPSVREEREEKVWGGFGARMSALAKRAKRAVERELDSDDDEEVVALSPVSPVSRSGWPSSSIGAVKAQGVVMPLNASEVRRERETVFVIGDEEDL